MHNANPSNKEEQLMTHSRNLPWSHCLLLAMGLFLWWTPPLQAQQCPSSQQCGSLCCTTSQVCHLGKCTNKGTACTSSSQCKSTEYCETKLGSCFPKQGATLSCEYKPPTGNYKPGLLWEWKPAATQVYSESMVTPVVMAMQDSNKDGTIDDKDIPTVLFVGMERYFGGGRGKGAIRAFRGTDGKLLFNAGVGLIHGWSPIAVGDIDKDGKPEIIAWRYNSANGYCLGINAYDNTGKLKWTSKLANGTISPSRIGAFCYTAAPLITDMDGDGNAEVVAGSTIVDGKTGRVICSGANTYTSYAADINGDGKQEIVTGSHAYDKTCKNLWTTTPNPSISGLADLNKDGKPEVVTAGSNIVTILNGQTGATISSINISLLTPRDTGGKGPSLGDVDGDGIPEIGVGARDYFHLLKYNPQTKKLTQLWTQKTRDYSSSGVSSSMFDFNFDGKVAVVYNDEISSYVFDGLTGKIFFKGAHRSGTVMEYPIIVDVNGDGRADLVSATSRNSAIGRLRVTQEIGFNWVNTRPVWNQYQYSVTNICTGDRFCPPGNKFGQPPAKPYNNWTYKDKNGKLGLNNFRLNAYGGHSDMNYQDSAYAIADLAVRNVQTQYKNCSTSSLEVIFQVSNIGSLRTVAGIPITVYRGTAASKVKWTTVTTTRMLRPGESEWFTVTVSAAAAGLNSVYVVADDDGKGVGSRRECNENNNSATKPFSPAATDPYCLGLVNDAPTITGTPGTSVGEDKTYTFSPGVTDPDPLNKHTWSKVAGPSSATVDPSTGKVTWTPAPSDVGKTVTFTIRVCDDGKPVKCANKTWKVTVTAANNPPQIAGTPGGTASSGQGYGYKPSVLDNDKNDTHTWKGNKLPAGATVDPQTGEVKWTPKASDNGKEFEFEIQVCDKGGLCATQTWKVRVGSGNQLPQIVGVPGTLATSNTNYRYAPTVVDPDTGDTHTWTLNQGPPGATIDPKTGQVNWLPGPNDTGKTFSFSITVCDSAGNCATQTWQTKVAGKQNIPPQIQGTPGSEALASTAYTYSPTVIDPDTGDTHTWKLKNGPSGATVDPKTGKLTWTPGPNDAGTTKEFEVEVCDQAGDCAIQIWRVTVKGQNQPPSISSTPGTKGQKGTAYSYKAKVTDPDAGDTHTWTLTKGPAGASIDATTGEVKWTPGTNQDNASHDFTVKVCDQAGNCATQSWQVNIGLNNTPPVITGTPGTKAEEGTQYEYEPKVTDPDAGDKHTWKLNNAPPGATIDPNSGKITWTPGNNDAGTSKVFEVEVCDQAGNCSRQSWTVQVAANHPPQIVGTPATQASTNKAYNFKPSVTDKDTNDTHTWKGTTLPPGATIDAQTGEINWTPKPEDAGKTVDFAIEVCDNKGECATRKWRVKVDGAENTPPAITGTPGTQANAGSAYGFSPGVNDPDKGDTHTWKRKSGPSSATVDPKTGEVKWTPGTADVGKDIEIEIEVCDDKGACATRKWKVRVFAGSQPPQMVGTPATQANTGKLYTFAPSLKDPDPKETYTWALNKGPSGATIDPKTGKLSWTPSKSDRGKIVEFEIQVCDSKGRCALRKWKVRVTDSDLNTPPLITSTPPTTGVQNTKYTYKPTAEDPDAGDKLTWKLKNGPTGANIDPTTGEVTWTPGAGDVGKSRSFEIEVCDSQGRCDTQTWTVQTKAANIPPTITSTAPTESYVGKEYNYPAKATDANAGDQLTWRLRQAPPGASIDPKTGELKWTPGASDTDNARTFEIEVCDNGTPRRCATQTFTITPRRTCRVDIDCKSGQICAKDTKGTHICIPSGCASNTPKCPGARSTCLDGKCQTDPCQNKTCGAGEVCRPSDGKCIKPCAGVSCNADERCVDGACVADPCAKNGNACKSDEVCDTSSSTPTCIKNPCNSASCRYGRTCDAQGRCVDDPCESMTCPDTNKQRCLVGQCVDLQDCQIDRECPETQVCIGGKCRKPGCYVNNSICSATGICLSTQCKDNQCPTPGGQACQGDEFCRAGDAQCTKTCAGVSCNANERCVNGACVADPCASKQCPSGFVCVSGDCKRANCDNSNNQCKHGRICSKQLNNCTDDPCFAVTCPGNSQICLNGQCIQKDCQFDSDCQGDDLCINNKCVAPTCQKDSDCQADERCVEGKCTKDSCAGKTCNNGEYCKNGACVGSCAGVFCSQKEVCIEGKCVADPCADVSCNADETCQNGTCVKDLCKGQNQPCKQGRKCNVDKCVADPCEGIKCNGSEQCVDGQCTGDRTCEVDIQCPGDGVCINGTCKQPGCYQGQSCQNNQSCQNGSCQEDPCANKQCGTNEVCRPSDGTCVKSCPRCPTGEICQDGACVADPCDGVTCQGDESCVNGTCTKDLCQANTPQCRFGRFCEANKCKDDPCAGMQCPNGQTCSNGVCIGDLPTEQTTEPSAETTTPDGGSEATTPEANTDNKMGDNTTTNDKGFTIGGGCGCQSNAPAPFGLWLLLIVGAFFITRRRRTSRS